MASYPPATALQPLKALYTAYFITTTLIKLPATLLYHVPRGLRQNPRWSWKTAVLVSLSKSFMHWTAAIEYHEPISLLPGKEKNRFTLIQPSSSEHYAGPTLDADISPSIVGGTWYPTKFDPSHPRKKVILHLHGGAYVIFSGRESSSGPDARAMSQHFDDAWVFCPDYRLANVPQGRFPAALQDAITTYRYLRDELQIPQDRIVLSGDSAGGHLVLNLLRYLREYAPGEQPLGALLWSPWTDLRDAERCARSRNAGVDFLVDGVLNWGIRAFTRGRPELAEEGSDVGRYVSPCHAPFDAGVPVWIACGTAEALYECIVEFAEKMKAIGNQLALFEVQDGVHDPLKTVDLVENEGVKEAMFKDAWAFVNKKVR